MTTAVCLGCRSEKRGAWTPCSRCGYDPVGRGLEEEARALLVSSRFASREQLSAAGAAIARGEPPPIHAAAVERLVGPARAAGQTSLVPPTPPWLRAAPYALFAILAALVLVLAALQLR